MQNTLSLVKDVRGCMTRFDLLTPEIVADQTEDGLTYDELKEVLEECGMDINKVVFDGTRAFQNAFYADFEQGHYCWIPFQKKSLKDVIRTMDQQFHSESFRLSRKNHEWTTFYMMDVPLPMQIYAAECYLVPDRHDHRGGHRRDRLRVFFKNRKKKSSTILEYSMLFPWLLPIILICYSIRHYFNSDTVWYVGNINLYFKNNVHILLIATYTLTKLPFALRMIRAAFYSIDTELEDAAKNLGSSNLRTFLRVKLPIIMPSVLAVSALSFSGGISDYDISASFASPYAVSFGMVLKSMTQGEGEGGLNMNATGRQMAATVFLMVFSAIILYLIYGVGGRDIAEKVAAKKKRQQFFAKLTGKFKKECV